MQHHLIRKPAAAGALALAILPGAAFAELTYNAGVFSDYRYRGISQTRLKPALQGGVDWAGSSGFYAGAWASTIKWIEDAYGHAKVEIDFYGGYKGELAKSLNFDLGVLQYVYPRGRTVQWDAAFKNPNTTEVYGALAMGPATAKLSYAASNLFGNYNFLTNQTTKGSWYLDLSASFALGGGWSVAPHVGRQTVRHLDVASYTDYALTVSKDFNGIVPSLSLVGTDADKGFYVPGGASGSTRFLGRTGVVAGVKVNF
jgi:uncharacterized protein (TIGR02001 family)